MLQVRDLIVWYLSDPGRFFFGYFIPLLAIPWLVYFGYEGFYEEILKDSEPGSTIRYIHRYSGAWGIMRSINAFGIGQVWSLIYFLIPFGFACLYKVPPIIEKIGFFRIYYMVAYLIGIVYLVTYISLDWERYYQPAYLASQRGSIDGRQIYSSFLIDLAFTIMFTGILGLALWYINAPGRTIRDEINGTPNM